MPIKREMETVKEKIRRVKIEWSKIYSFSCIRPSVLDSGRHSLTGPGFSRVVCCNQPQMHRRKPLNYPSNYISTTKYNALTFLPKATFEQFRRVANLYFLLAAILSLTPVAPFSAVSMIAPLAFVVGLSMAKEALEDWRRFMQDMKVNSRKVSVHKGEGKFGIRTWEKIRVGDVVKVEKDQFFPSDLLLLSSSYQDGICYVETMNLDGETNLKVKRAMGATISLDDDGTFTNFTATIRCEDPNPNLYTFIGNLEYQAQVFPMDPSQVLLRDSKLRNTEFVYGVAIFTGHDTKVMQNGTKSPSKRSTIEKRMDYIIYILFTVLVLISLISSIGFAAKTKFSMPNWWYMQPNKSTNLYNPNEAALSGLFHLVTALILYGYLIPISLYVSIEVVKVLQATFINQDIQMFDDETGNSADARTSNLNEELGQVVTILSDKTGTLTCNQMEFLKCCIAGESYGIGCSEVELAAAKQMAGKNDDGRGSPDSSESEDEDFQAADDVELEGITISKYENGKKPSIKGFAFEDERLMKGIWIKEPNATDILMFLRILSVCHAALPVLNSETGGFNYEAESPDEAALLVAAREFGFEFCRRTQTSVYIQEQYPTPGKPIEREYKILNLLEFSSKRKRMSVIVKTENDEILLMCKGADSIILERLSKDGKAYVEDTMKHLNEYGEAGLRTLVVGYKKLTESEYLTWNAEFQKAKTTIGPDRELLLERASDSMENGLILVGATAVEDKLQKGVPGCIDKLAQAGLKIWVLTGDKMETAINIGYACSLLRQGMKQICLSVKSNVESLGKDLDKVAKEDILVQIAGAAQMIKLDKDPDAAFALIIDGKALSYALDNDVKHHFLSLAVECASVICCRVSPKQKALVTRLVKEGTGSTTLGIGDGANDVGMIQEADIGVGISGVEGMQAVMASDFSISQFRFLERLLLIHGHWCYKRIAQMICYFFYKNIAFGLTIFYFEAFTGFSGQSAYDDWYMLLFNVILTSLPVISLGVFEQDVCADVCLQFPALYQQGPRNLFFDWSRIFGWMANGVYSSLIIFFPTVFIIGAQAFREGGQIADMSTVGTIMFTCIIWTVNCQIALTMSHFTWMQHLFVWGSISTWYIFLLFYGLLSPTMTGDSFRIFMDVIAPAPIYWSLTLLITAACTLPYLSHISFQRAFRPLDHHIIQEIKYLKKDLTDKPMWRRERTKARQKTKIGFTARVEVKIRHLKGKLNRKQSILCYMPQASTKLSSVS